MVRILGAVIEIPVLAVLHPRQHLLFCGTIAFELVRDDDPRNILAALEQLAEEFLGRVFVPQPLDQDIQDMTVLIHRPPQVVAFAMDCQKDLIEVPLVAWSGTPAAQLVGIGLPKLPAPVAYRLIRQDDATCRHQLLDVPVAQAEAEIQPDTVADDLCWEAMALI